MTQLFIPPHPIIPIRFISFYLVFLMSEEGFEPSLFVWFQMDIQQIHLQASPSTGKRSINSFAVDVSLVLGFDRGN